MSDLMLHGVLNMPLPDDPAECDLVTWFQFKDRARQASCHITDLQEKLEAMNAIWAKVAAEKEVCLGTITDLETRLQQTYANAQADRARAADAEAALAMVRTVASGAIRDALRHVPAGSRQALKDALDRING